MPWVRVPIPWCVAHTSAWGCTGMCMLNALRACTYTLSSLPACDLHLWAHLVRTQPEAAVWRETQACPRPAQTLAQRSLASWVCFAAMGTSGLALVCSLAGIGRKPGQAHRHAHSVASNKFFCACVSMGVSTKVHVRMQPCMRALACLPLYVHTCMCTLPAEHGMPVCACLIQNQGASDLSVPTGPHWPGMG